MVRKFPRAKRRGAVVRAVPIVRLLLPFFLATAALAGPMAPGEAIDERFFAATSVDERREVLIDALAAIERLGHDDPLLVWRTGILIGGLLGHEATGGLLIFERIGEAPIDGRVTWGDLGPHVAAVEWNSATMRTEWIEHVREFGLVPGARSSTGRYRVRTHPEFHALLTAEVEARMGHILLSGEIKGSELERHLIRAIWSSYRERVPALNPFIRRMIPLTCAEAIRNGTRKR